MKSGPVPLLDDFKASLTILTVTSCSFILLSVKSVKVSSYALITETKNAFKAFAILLEPQTVCLLGSIIVSGPELVCSKNELLISWCQIKLVDVAGSSITDVEQFFGCSLKDG